MKKVKNKGTATVLVATFALLFIVLIGGIITLEKESREIKEEVKGMGEDVVIEKEEKETKEEELEEQPAPPLKDYYYFEDFSNTPRGQLPENWFDSSSIGCHAFVIDSFQGRSKVLEITDSGSCDTIGSVKYVSPSKITGKFIVEYKYFWTNNYANPVKPLNSEAKGPWRIWIYGNYFQWKDERPGWSSGWHSLSYIKGNVWHDFKLFIDTDVNTLDLYVDDNLIIRDLKARWGGTDDVKEFHFSTIHCPVSNQYIDDFRITASETVTDSCFDSDGGLHEYIYGRTTEGSLTSGDICQGSNLKEWYCSSAGKRSEYILCEHGCIDGVCKKGTGNDETTGVVCLDSDNGKDYYIHGSVKHSEGSSTSYDHCLDNYVLRENYCDNGYYAFESYFCPGGCKNGVCLKEEVISITCGDSDWGKNYYQKGTVSGHIDKDLPNITRTLSDYCLDSNMLREYFCFLWDDGSKTIDDEVIECDYGCNNGACQETMGFKNKGNNLKAFIY